MNYKCYTIAICESGVSPHINKSPGVRISLLCDDPYFHTAKYFRRDLTYSRNSTFIEIKNDAGDDFLGFVNSKEVTDQHDLRDGHLYEYMCKIMTKYGSTYHSAPFPVKHVYPDNFATAGIVRDNDKTYTISIEKVESRKNIVNELFDLVKETGEQDLFTEDISKINQASQELLSAEISKLSFKEGTWEYELIGNFKNGESFNISLPENLELLEPDQSKYLSLIKIQIFQNSPIQIVKKIQELINTIDRSLENTTPSAIEQSVKLTKAKKELSELRESQQKMLSREFVAKGMLPADKKPESLLNELEKIKTALPVDDVYYQFLSDNQLESSDISLLDPLVNLTLTISNAVYYKFQDGRISLNFNLVVPDLKSQYIDFYIVLCKKNNDYFPVTTIMGSDTGDITIIDATSKNFMGEATYYLQPLFVNGNLGSRYLIKKINYYNVY
jgi:hypothetical protein